MTVETELSRVQYATNGTTGPWSIPFAFLADADLQLSYTAAGTDPVTLTATVDYALTGAGNPAGGSATTTTAYASGGLLTIVRNVAALQPTDFSDTDPLPAESLERALDRLTHLVQQLKEQVSRALVLPVDENGPAVLPATAERASRILGFDSDGGFIGVLPTGGDATSLALDMASVASAAKGSGQVGFSHSLTYLYPTIGHLLQTQGINVRAHPYNVKSDGTDQSAALQAAITAAGTAGVGVYLGTGTISVASQLVVHGSTAIRGAGMRSTILRWIGNSTSAGIITTGDGAETDNVQFMDFGLSNDGTNCRHGIEFKTIRGYAARIFSNSPKAFAFAVICTDVDNTVFHMALEDCALFVSGNTAVTPYGFVGARGHTIALRGCMFSGFGTAGVRLGGYAGGSVGTQVVGGTLVGCRFESFSNLTDAYPGSATAIGLEAYEVEGLTVSGGSFEMAGDQESAAAAQRAIKLRTVNGGSISGVYFSGAGQATAGIDVADVGATGVEISGNTFFNFNGPGIAASGSGDLLNVEIGINKISAGTTKIADQSWTPVLSFGGSSTGITYDAATTGRCYRMGQMIHYHAVVLLTNKGSQTGVARVTIPRTAPSSDMDRLGDALLSSYTTGALRAFVLAGSAQVRLLDESGTELTDSSFSNTSRLTINVSVSA